jgi:hypothetical protein
MQDAKAMQKEDFTTGDKTSDAEILSGKCFVNNFWSTLSVGSHHGKMPGQVFWHLYIFTSIVSGGLTREGI